MAPGLYPGIHSQDIPREAFSGGFPDRRRKRILNLLANMGTEGIAAFVCFDLENASLSQLQEFNDELELAMMVENKYEPELDG